jgi:hypothetical protein
MAPQVGGHRYGGARIFLNGSGFDPSLSTKYTHLYFGDLEIPFYSTSYGQISFILPRINETAQDQYNVSIVVGGQMSVQNMTFSYVPGGLPYGCSGTCPKPQYNYIKTDSDGSEIEVFANSTFPTERNITALDYNSLNSTIISFTSNLPNFYITTHYTDPNPSPNANPIRSHKIVTALYKLTVSQNLSKNESRADVVISNFLSLPLVPYSYITR